MLFLILTRATGACHVLEMKNWTLILASVVGAQLPLSFQKTKNGMTKIVR
jgi:hypothetical protein